MRKFECTYMETINRTRFNSIRRSCVRLVLPSTERRQTGEERKFDSLQVVLYQSLHLVAPHAPDSSEDVRDKNAKAPVGKLQKRAGATPLFRLSAAQRVQWGRSRPGTPCPVPIVFS